MHPIIVEESPPIPDEKPQPKPSAEIGQKHEGSSSNESNISLGETGSNPEESPGLKPTVNKRISPEDSISNASPKLNPAVTLKPKVEPLEPHSAPPSGPPKKFYQRLPTHMVNARRKSNEPLLTILGQAYRNHQIPKVRDTYLQKATSPGPGTPMPSSKQVPTFKLVRSLSVSEARNKKPSQPV